MYVYNTVSIHTHTHTHKYIIPSLHISFSLSKGVAFAEQLHIYVYNTVSMYMYVRMHIILYYMFAQQLLRGLQQLQVDSSLHAFS